MLQFKGIIRAIARPTVGRRVVGEQNGKPEYTSQVVSVMARGGLALVHTQHSWYIVLPIKPPAPQAVPPQRANGR